MLSPAWRGRVVLLHGQPGTGIGWRRVIAALGESFHVLAPDRPGYGRNPAPAGGVGGNADWLGSLVDEQEDGAPTVVVAHSWAGGPALELAYRRPDAIHGLVLLGSVGPGAVTRADRVLAHPVVGPTAARVALGPADPLLRWRLRLDRSTSGKRRLWQTFLVEQRALIAELPRLLDHIDRIETPALVVAGTRDRVVPFTTAEALAARLPNAALVPVPRAGHPLHRTHPRVIARAIHRVFADAVRQ